MTAGENQARCRAYYARRVAEDPCYILHKSAINIASQAKMMANKSWRAEFLNKRRARWAKNQIKVRKNRTAACAICGTIFKPSHGFEILCSPNCKRLRVNQTLLASYHRRKKTDVYFNLRKKISSAVSKGLRITKRRKPSSCVKFLPFTFNELKAHIETQFTEVNGFNWSNYGSKWQIDHIKPQAYFRYTSLESDAFKECWSLSNLRPLGCHENATKGARLLAS